MFMSEEDLMTSFAYLSILSGITSDVRKQTVVEHLLRYRTGQRRIR